MSSNPLDPIMDWYANATDIMTIAFRGIDQHGSALISDPNSHFFGVPVSDAEELILKNWQELDELTALALVARFEPYIKSLVQACTVVSAPTAMPPAAAARAIAHVTASVHRMRFKDQILRFFNDSFTTPGDRKFWMMSMRSSNIGTGLPMEEMLRRSRS